MKNNIHPKYSKLTLQIGKDTFDTMSTNQSGKIVLDVDFRRHPAWNKDSTNIVNQANENISKFGNKYAGLSFLGKK